MCGRNPIKPKTPTDPKHGSSKEDWNFDSGFVALENKLELFYLPSSTYRSFYLRVAVSRFCFFILFSISLSWFRDFSFFYAVTSFIPAVEESFSLTHETKKKKKRNVKTAKDKEANRRVYGEKTSKVSFDANSEAFPLVSREIKVVKKVRINWKFTAIASRWGWVQCSRLKVESGKSFAKGLKRSKSISKGSPLAATGRSYAWSRGRKRCRYSVISGGTSSLPAGKFRFHGTFGSPQLRTCFRAQTTFLLLSSSSRPRLGPHPIPHCLPLPPFSSEDSTHFLLSRSPRSIYVIVKRP